MNRDILLFSHVANRDVFFLRLERPLIAFFEIPLRGHTKFQYFQLHISIQFCLNLVISCAGCVRCLLLQNENTKTPIIELFLYEPRTSQERNIFDRKSLPMYNHKPKKSLIFSPPRSTATPTTTPTRIRGPDATAALLIAAKAYHHSLRFPTSF